MLKKSSALMIVSVALLLPQVRSQTVPGSPELARVSVTVVAHKGAAPPVTAQDVLVRQGDTRRPVVSWEPATGAPAGKLDLAMLIDDSLDTTLGNQFNDITKFLRELPATTRVAVAYASFGSAVLQQDFTADHEAAVKALRLPFGRGDSSSGLYLSLVDLLKKWPTGDSRGAVLLVSDGIDLFRGVRDTSPMLNQDLQQAIDAAQRRGVNVFTIYARGAARFTRNFFLLSNGQSSLGRLALETGGDAYFQGFDTPLAFTPFLDELSAALRNQYVLTFRAPLGARAGFARLRVSTELAGVELRAPSQVYLPAAPK